jgi:putative hydrolase of the HAD superfamily
LSNIIFPDIDLNGVKGVLIDLDNTIYDYKIYNKKALKYCYDLNYFEGSFEEFVELFLKHRKIIVARLFPLSSCRSRALTFQSMMEELGQENPFEKALELSECYWDNFIDMMEIDKKALEFLEKCYEKNIPVCLVTDMTIKIQIRKVKSLEISKHLKYIVCSEEVGIEKPDEKMFLRALEKLNLKPDEVIMVGDAYEKDIVGVENLGIKSYHVELKD